MRRPPGASILAGIVLALALAVGTAGCSFGGCATALATGTLTAQGEELGLRTASGEVMRIDWPDGYGPVTGPDGELVLAHVFGGITASQGDTVAVGGGMATDNGTFQGCGDVWVSEAGLR